ncbi:MAG: hypothetical protein EAZ08_06270 [Cytophagales bacterium]|nr:MAG: hypothetical protein EAZ08_06270 [Cytophagales bacterium]
MNTKLQKILKENEIPFIGCLKGICDSLTLSSGQVLQKKRKNDCQGLQDLGTAFCVCLGILYQISSGKKSVRIDIFVDNILTMNSKTPLGVKYTRHVKRGG